MKSKKNYDLTQGPIMNRLLLVAIPIMGTQLMQMTYNLTDMFWLGRVGSDAVAASGAAGMYLWLSMAFLLFGRMGAEIGVSQNLGRGDEESALGFSQAAVFLSVCFGLLIAFVMVVFTGPLISFFNIREAHVSKSSADYLRVVALALPLTYASAAMTGTFTGSGNSKLPFFANAIGLVFNMILDPVFIFVFDMGIIGAAIATVIAQTIVCLVLFILMRSGRERPFRQYRFFVRPDNGKIRIILKWSTPISLESLLFTVLSMVISRFIAAFGADALAVSRVGSQIESLSWLIGGGFGSAVTSFIGQNFGAGKWTRIRKCFKISMYAMTAWGVVITLIMFFLGRNLFTVFLREPNILDMGQKYLMVLALCQIPTCLEAVAAGVFRGIGETVPPSASSITGNALRVPLTFLLSLTPLGLDGIWLGISAGAILRSLILMVWYYLRSKRLPRADIA